MRQQTARLYQWAIQKANSERARWWLGLIFALELVLIIPLDAVLVFFCLQDQKKSFLYALIAAVTSTCSGLIGYLIGRFFWDLAGSFIIPYLISASFFEHLSHQLHLYENWAVFISGFLPLPMKAISLASGVFELNLFSFITFLFLARFLRFFLIGSAMLLWGERVKLFVDRHFHRIFMIIGAKLAMAFVLFWALAR